RSDCRKVACKHVSRRNVSPVGRGPRPFRGPLFAGKEKQFVPDDRSADCSSKLVSLEPVVRKSEGVSSIERPIAQKFEKISVIVVRAGLCYRIYGAGGMEAVLGGQAAGFHLEFLQCVRKWKRQIQVVVGVVVVRAVQAVGQSSLHAPGNL